MRIEHDLFEQIGGGEKYHSAIVTCFSFDPVFFSNLYLPYLRSAGAKNIIVLVDATNYDSALDGFVNYGDMVPDMKCHLVRMTPSSLGVFHPKMVALFGKKDAFLAIGSGNLTYSGYMQNDELWGAFQVSGKTSPNYPILRQAWRYLLDLLPKDDAIDRQIMWMRENCSCIETAEQNSEEYAAIGNHTRAYFIANSKQGTIYSQLSEIVGDETVNAIKAISPFYDQSSFLGLLQKRYMPVRISLIIDKLSPLLPLQKQESWHSYAWESPSKRLHGKAFQFETDDKTILVIGSANATVAAWGNDSIYSNDEACIVLVSEEKRDYFEELEIRFDTEVELINQNKSGYPEGGDTKHGYDYHILSCICNAEGVFFITLDNDISNGELSFLNQCGTVLSQHSITSTNKRIQFKIDFDSTRKMVALSKNEAFISNKCLILSEYQLQGMNPNETNRKLDQLLEASPDWEGAIESILSYAGYHSDKWDEVRQMSGTRKAASDKQKEEKQDSGIGRDDFDHVILGGGVPPHVAANLKITDFLNAKLKGSSLNNDDSEVDNEYTQKEKDSGVPEDGPNGKRDVEKKTKVVNVYKALMSFCSKVEGSYDRAIKKKKRKLNGVPEPFDIEPTLDDYSIFATVIISAFYCQLHEEKQYKFNWFNFTLSFVSKFLYIFRVGYPEGHGYTYAKLQELQKDSSVYILLLLSYFFWERKDALVEVLVLNLLDSLPDKESIIEQYWLDRKVKILKYRDDSRDKLDAIFKKYSLLERVKTPIKDISDGQLSKRGAIGYSSIWNMKKNNNGSYSYDCLHPAFMEDPLRVQCIGSLPIYREKIP